MEQERPLHPFTEGDSPHREGLAGSRALAARHEPLEHLNAGFLILEDLDEDLDRIPHPEGLAIGLQVGALDQCNLLTVTGHDTLQPNRVVAGASAAKRPARARR